MSESKVATDVSSATIEASGDVCGGFIVGGGDVRNEFTVAGRDMRNEFTVAGRDMCHGFTVAGRDVRNEFTVAGRDMCHGFTVGGKELPSMPTGASEATTSKNASSQPATTRTILRPWPAIANATPAAYKPKPAKVRFPTRIHDRRRNIQNQPVGLGATLTGRRLRL